MTADLIIVIGAYGSGKSEYAINLADMYNKKGQEVFLIDLDVVNPYFRSRDVRDYFTDKGINVICPEGDYSYADVPMISPKIAGAIRQKNKVVILDVGGDPSGCRALARFTEAIIDRGYEMHYIINTFRPFTGNKLDVLAMIKNLESASKLIITELISNTNLLDETTEEIIAQGIRIIDNVSKETKKPFSKYLVLDKFTDKIGDGIGNKKRMILQYYLQKPWEKIIIKGL